MKYNRDIRKKIISTLICLGFMIPYSLYSISIVQQTPAPEFDLSEIFENRLVQDTNKDGIPDMIAARFLLDQQLSPEDIEGAAAIAARLGFESSAMDPSLWISSVSEARKLETEWLIIFNTIPNEPGPGEPCGIKIYRQKGMKIIEIFGTTPQARKYAAVNFFARHPYIWDITGRETGELWQQLKDDVLLLFPETRRNNISVSVSAVHYRYHKPINENMKKRRQERLGLTATQQKKGEVQAAELDVVLHSNLNDVPVVFNNLKARHQRGKDTKILNYGGLRTTIIHLKNKENQNKVTAITIPRISVPQRFLNPTTDSSYYRKKVTIPPVDGDIANFYSTEGIYKDSNKDGNADQLVSKIIYDGPLNQNFVNLAARIGLEDCVVNLPFTLPAEDIDMKSIKNLERPILIGSANRYTRYLEKIGKTLEVNLKNDEGLIQYSSGYNPGGIYIISGTSPKGENAALQYAAATLPYISVNSTQPGAPVWKDLNREIELFFSRKNDAGIAAWGILQMDKQKKVYTAPDLEESKTELYTLRHIDKLEQFLTQRLKSYRKLTGESLSYSQQLLQKTGKQKKNRFEYPELSIETGGRLESGKGFSDHYSPQWEVEAAREVFIKKILPQLETLTKTESKSNKDPLLFIDLRLSEPGKILENQVTWLKEQIARTGISMKKVKIRTTIAYKQGFHWIKDNIIPQLKSLHAAAIDIHFAPHPLDLENTTKYRAEPVRWLQELYPIDEIMEKELEIPLTKIQFIKDQNLKGVVYKLIARDKNGSELFRESFSPYTVEIPFQNRYPEWEPVTVSTGGIRVYWQDKEIFFTRIETDPLRLWKHYQEKILPRLTEMAEKQAGAPLKTEDQPFFSKLQAEVWMSEPDYRLGLDEEQVSSLESFHEDIYFNTLDYFQSLLKKDPEMDMKNPLMAQRWAAPGNIVPIIHADGMGKRPKMETKVTALEALTPKIKMEFQYKEVKQAEKIVRNINPVQNLRKPRLVGIRIDNRGIAKEAIYQLELNSEQELSEAVDMLEILKNMQKNKIFTKIFSYQGLSTISFILTAPERLQAQVLINLGEDAAENSSSQKLLFKKITKQTLDKKLASIIDPAEAVEIAESLGTLPEITTYIGGYSYQGRAVPVMEIGLKAGGSLVSKNKLTTLKPTVFLLGRQHANEVSSTNYGFNIAWLLAKDPAYRKYLEHLNIVIEPMENPDGSALAVKLQKLTPHHMLHAGRYSALGTDIGYHVNKSDTLITEAKVRKAILDRWQPDIFLNNHGYPSHEWVQQFSHYTPYLFRAYWIPRGWYYFHTGLDGIGTPLHKKASSRIVEIITQKMKDDEEIFAVNRRIYDRYHRWAERWQPQIHYLELYNGTNIYKKRRRTTARKHTLQRDITVLEAIPEAMDETALNGWLKLAIRQGTLFVTSFFDLAIEAEQPVERIEEEIENVIHLQLLRHRPLRVKAKE